MIKSTLIAIGAVLIIALLGGIVIYFFGSKIDAADGKIISALIAGTSGIIGIIISNFHKTSISQQNDQKKSHLTLLVKVKNLQFHLVQDFITCHSLISQNNYSAPTYQERTEHHFNRLNPRLEDYVTFESGISYLKPTIMNQYIDALRCINGLQISVDKRHYENDIKIKYMTFHYYENLATLINHILILQTTLGEEIGLKESAEKPTTNFQDFLAKTNIIKHPIDSMLKDLSEQGKSNDQN